MLVYQIYRSERLSIVSRQNVTKGMCFGSINKILVPTDDSLAKLANQNAFFSRKTPQCCVGYELDSEVSECRHICVTPCENYGACVAPSMCKCDYGYEGNIVKWVNGV